MGKIINSIINGILEFLFVFLNVVMVFCNENVFVFGFCILKFLVMKCCNVKNRFLIGFIIERER